MSDVPNYKAELIGVFGHPVSENPTVVMHEAGFRALGLNWRYLTIEVYPEDLENAMKGLRAFNMRGINLTIPHKVEVLKYLDEVKSDAALMGDVNTVIRAGDKLIGENTDGKGFMRSLAVDAGISPEGKEVVVLGAGGAARSITVELALAGAKKITIVNRSTGRGRILSELLSSKTPVESEFVPWKGPYSIPANTGILVNATSIGLFPNSSDKPDIDYNSIRPGMTVCDVIHTPVTPFLAEAKSRGAITVDGLGMLVYQGAIGFKLWTGIDAPVKEMHLALSKAFGLVQGDHI
ncbi:MAG: shikimate dehydrogenase [Brevinematales bacterium]|jgi:shikimate dehydrogenase